MKNATPPELPVERRFTEAIALKLLVTAVYNGGEVLLAPHQLFTRHGDLMIGALNMKRNWPSEDERQLGYFKISGLSNVTLTQDTFEPIASYDGTLPREGDTLVFAVEIS